LIAQDFTVCDRTVAIPVGSAIPDPHNSRFLPY
jgi:hypothetical protein